MIIPNWPWRSDSGVRHSNVCIIFKFYWKPEIFSKTTKRNNMKEIPSKFGQFYQNLGYQNLPINTHFLSSRIRGLTTENLRFSKYKPIIPIFEDPLYCRA